MKLPPGPSPDFLVPPPPARARPGTTPPAAGPSFLIFFYPASFSFTPGSAHSGMTRAPSFLSFGHFSLSIQSSPSPSPFFSFSPFFFPSLPLLFPPPLLFSHFPNRRPRTGGSTWARKNPFLKKKHSLCGCRQNLFFGGGGADGPTRPDQVPPPAPPRTVIYCVGAPPAMDSRLCLDGGRASPRPPPILVPRNVRGPPPMLMNGPSHAFSFFPFFALPRPVCVFFLFFEFFFFFFCSRAAAAKRRFFFPPPLFSSSQNFIGVVLPRAGCGT